MPIVWWTESTQRKTNWKSTNNLTKMPLSIRNKPGMYCTKEWSTCPYTIRVCKVSSKAGGKCSTINSSHSKMDSQFSKKDSTLKSIWVNCWEEANKKSNSSKSITETKNHLTKMKNKTNNKSKSKHKEDDQLNKQ